MMKAEDLMQMRVEKEANAWVIDNGNKITSDELVEFFWRTFINLKGISEKTREKTKEKTKEKTREK